MALATQCPHCHTTFRVASDQLKLRGGIVRCGACQRIFDGNAHLIDLEALAARKASEAAQAGADATPAAAPAPEPAPVAPAAPALASPSPAEQAEAPAAAPSALEAHEAPADAGAGAGAQPVYTLDFDHTFDPFGILPKAEPTLDADGGAVEPVAPADAGMTGRIEPRFDVRPDGDADMPPPGEDVHDAMQTAATADSLAPEAELEPEPEPEADPAPTPEPALAAAPAATLDPAYAPDALPPSTPPAAPEPGAAPEPDLPPAASPAPAHAYAPAGRIEPSFDLPVDEALVAQPLHEYDPDLEPDLEPHLHPDPQQAAHADTPDAHATALPADTAADAGPGPDAAADTAIVPSAPLPLRASTGHDAAFANTDSAHDGPAPKSARAKAAEARARRSKLTPTRIEAPRLRVPASSESDEPEFVKRSRRQERSGKTVRILMAVGAAALLLLLAAQLLVAYRSELALRYPAARPLLNGLCAAAGCRVGLPAKADNLVIDDGELAPIGVDTYSLNTTLRNQGSLVQAWPSIELELTDANNKPLLRRVFGPADYLPAGAANGFGAHSEQPVRLNFALADIKPSGYHTFVFYP